MSDRIRRRRGASLVEYVSAMAIGAALLAGGGMVLGDLTRTTFDRFGGNFAPVGRLPRDNRVSAAPLAPKVPTAPQLLISAREMNPLLG